MDMLALFIIFGLLLALFGLFFTRLLQVLYRMPRKGVGVTSDETPSVSVCIPARNEMHALTECLERVLASTYPKLEVIVLDDESQDETPIIIKSFAHAGVRFIPGGPLPEGWIGKNYALDVLAREANGAIIIFMDVDTAIAPHTITSLVGHVTEHTDMISVIPRRDDANRASVLFGTLRYFWQLVFDTPTHRAVSSSLWMIKRKTLLDHLKGFSEVRTAIEPEAMLAAVLGKRYAGFVGTLQLGVRYEKKWRSQIDTSRRLLVPFFRRVKVGALGGLLMLTVLNLPTLSVVYAVIFGWQWPGVAAACLLGFFSFLYGFYASHLWRQNWWLAVLLWPYIAAQELIIMLLSMMVYLRGTVFWKDRPIATSAVRHD